MWDQGVCRCDEDKLLESVKHYLRSTPLPCVVIVFVGTGGIIRAYS